MPESASDSTTAAWERVRDIATQRLRDGEDTRSVRREINRELRGFYLQQAFSRQQSRQDITAHIRDFRSEVLQYRRGVRDELYIAARQGNQDAIKSIESLAENAEQGPRSAGQRSEKEKAAAGLRGIALSPDLLSKREALLSRIDSAEALTDSERWRARTVLMLDRDDIAVFKPDPSVLLDAVKYLVQSLQKAMGHSAARLRDATAERSPRATVGVQTQHADHAAPAPAAGHNPAGFAVSASERAGCEEQQDRDESLIAWVAALPDRAASDYTARIVADLNDHLKGVTPELGDRALVVTAAIVKDTRDGIAIDYDAADLMADSERFEEWNLARYLPELEVAPEISAEVDAGVAAAQLAQPGQPYTGRHRASEPDDNAVDPALLAAPAAEPVAAGAGV